MKYKAYVTYQVIQSIEVEAEDVDEALDKSLDNVTLPSGFDKFENDSEPIVESLYEEDLSGMGQSKLVYTEKDGYV